MSDRESLLLVLAIIYLTECLVWVPRSALAFTRWWGKSFRLRLAGTLAGNQHGALFLANPLPPLGPVFVNQHLPLSVSSEAAFAYTAACLDPAGRPLQTARFIPFNAMRAVAAKGKKVEVNGAVFLKTSSTLRARQLADWLDRLRKLEPSERRREIRQTLQAGFSTRQVADRLQAFRERTRTLRVLSHVLFFYLLVLAPAALWEFGLRHVGWELLIGLLAQTTLIACLARRAHQALYPEADEERFKLFLTLLLTPPAGIRAADVLGRPLLETAHPLAIARQICSPDQLQAWARQYLLDLRYPLLPVCPTSDAAAARCEQEFRAALLEATEEFLVACGLKPAALTAPPERLEPANQSYCPRCSAQFISPAGACPDCGGRQLVAFE